MDACTPTTQQAPAAATPQAPATTPPAAAKTDNVLAIFFRGILRLSDDAVWNVQASLFLIGGTVEWLLLTSLAKDCATVMKLDPRIPVLFAGICAATAVVHQFLIFRNFEIERAEHEAGTGAPTPSRLQKFLQHALTFVGVALLGTITGEVPYILALLLFKDGGGPANSTVHFFDVLNVFDGIPSWGGLISTEQLRMSYQIYTKALFLTASQILAVVILISDFAFHATPRYQRDHSSFLKVRVWKVFAFSDALSLLVWVLFFSILQDVHRSTASPGKPYSLIVLIGVTFVYALFITLRIVCGANSQSTSLSVRQEIV